jgi:hypothetical protein
MPPRSPKEALGWIGPLWCRDNHNGTAPDERRRQRQLQWKPIAAAVKTWVEKISPKLSGRSECTVVFRYTLGAGWRDPLLRRWLTDLNNNPAELLVLRLPSSGRIISLPTASEQRLSTRSSKPPSATLSIQKPLWAISSRTSSKSCSGIGSPRSSSPSFKGYACCGRSSSE